MYSFVQGSQLVPCPHLPSSPYGISIDSASGFSTKKRCEEAGSTQILFLPRQLRYLAFRKAISEPVSSASQHKQPMRWYLVCYGLQVLCRNTPEVLVGPPGNLVDPH